MDFADARTFEHIHTRVCMHAHTTLTHTREHHLHTCSLLPRQTVRSRGSTDDYCVSLCHNLSEQAEVRLWVLGSQSLFSNFCRVFMLYCQDRTDNLDVDTVRQPRNVETPSNVLVFSERSGVSFSFFA